MAQLLTCHTAPAADVISYEPVNFVTGLSKVTIYRDEPSEAVDKAWLDLYNGELDVPNLMCASEPDRC